MANVEKHSIVALKVLIAFVVGTVSLVKFNGASYADPYISCRTVKEFLNGNDVSKSTKHNEEYELLVGDGPPASAKTALFIRVREMDSVKALFEIRTNAAQRWSIIEVRRVIHVGADNIVFHSKDKSCTGEKYTFVSDVASTDILINICSIHGTNYVTSKILQNNNGRNGLCGER